MSISIGGSFGEISARYVLLVYVKDVKTTTAQGRRLGGRSSSVLRVSKGPWLRDQRKQGVVEKG